MPVNPCGWISTVLLMAVCFAALPSHAQPVSGQWKGRVGGPTLGLGRSYQVELRILREGDSLIGVADYRTLGNNHVRMPVRGYFNPMDGTVSWWHDAPQGVDEKGRTAQDLLPAGMVFDTDFKCPDGSTLKLDGLASLTTWSGRGLEMPIHLQKTGEAEFRDPWERSVVGSQGGYPTPGAVDRASKGPPVAVSPPKESKPLQPDPKPVAIAPPPPLRKEPEIRPDPKPVAVAPPPPLRKEPEIRPNPKPVAVAPPPPLRKEPEIRPDPKPVAVAPPPPLRKEPEIRPDPKPVAVDRPVRVLDPAENTPAPVPRPPTPDAGIAGQWLKNRDRRLVEEIEVSGDTLWLNFYDHAEVDGDSISIFLGNRLLASHILLKATPHTLGIPLTDIGDSAELTMVAENLGSIPPNTSLLILYVEGVRHEARLESTERTSAMVRFRKKGQRP